MTNFLIHMKQVNRKAAIWIKGKKRHSVDFEKKEKSPCSTGASSTTTSSRYSPCPTGWTTSSGSWRWPQEVSWICWSSRSIVTSGSCWQNSPDRCECLERIINFHQAHRINKSSQISKDILICEMAKGERLKAAGVHYCDIIIRDHYSHVSRDSS